jgi:SagB-type dehydrogenase family enzyme
MCTGFLAGNAEGFDPGLYLLDPSSSSITRIDSGSFMDRMAHTCLNQGWLANAAVHFLFISNLDSVDQVWGSRGYRYAMMTAGMLGERLYLMGTAMGLGCCGIGAFYDTEAARLLGLNSTSRLLYLVAVGPVKSGA